MVMASLSLFGNFRFSSQVSGYPYFESYLILYITSRCHIGSRVCCCAAFLYLHRMNSSVVSAPTMNFWMSFLISFIETSLHLRQLTACMGNAHGLRYSNLLHVVCTRGHLLLIAACCFTAPSSGDSSTSVSPATPATHLSTILCAISQSASR